jgi:hypothetical protein
MEKLLIIVIVLLAVIVPTVILRVQSRVEEIPDMLYENYRDLGSYALNFGIKKVVSEKITDSKLVEYENFQVLDGSIESIEYVFHNNLKEEEESFTDVLIMAEVSWNVRGETRYHDAEAVLEVVTVGGIIGTFPERTIWAVNDETPPLLHYYVLSEVEEEEVPDPDDFVHWEGVITGIKESNADIEAFTMDEDGVMYFMNCSGPSVLYKIDPENPEGNIDKDPDTEVKAVKIGNTGMVGKGEITNLEFIDGVLYGIGRSNEKVFSFDNLEPGNFSFTHIADLNVPGKFTTDGLTQGADGEIYLNWTRSSNSTYPSELWKFNSFPDGGITKVCDITGSKKVEALAAHPNGLIYAADDFHWFSIDPVTHVVEIVIDYEVDIEGIDFYYEAEEIFVEGNNEFKLVYWNPW